MKTVKRMLAGVFALGLMAAGPWAMAEDEKRVGDAYSLDVCAVSGEPLGSMGDPIVLVKDGRELRLCCAGCNGAVEKQTESVMSKVDEKMTADQQEHYPLEACLITGQPAGVEFVAGNRLFKTCCNNCKGAVEKDVEAHIEKLDAEVVKAQSEDYEATTCPVSGKDLGDDAVNKVVANRLIKLCCAGCVGAVDKDPSKFLKEDAEG